jgi:RNA polymerase sigma-70 factor (ECF subfamily)
MDTSSTPPHDDQDVKLAVAGDRNAFARLFDLYYAALYRYFFFHLGNQQDAEDLAGQVFLKAWQNLASFDPGKGTFKNWVYRVAHNVLVDVYRKQRHDIHLDEEMDEIGHTGKRLEDALIGKQQTELLYEALSMLDQRSRAVIIYRFISGFDHRETAQLVGISESNVRVIQLRALKKIRHFFAEVENG